MVQDTIPARTQTSRTVDMFPSHVSESVSSASTINVSAHGTQLPYPTTGGIPYPTEASELDLNNLTGYPPEQRAAIQAAAAQFREPYDEDLAYGTLPEAALSSRQRSASTNSRNRTNSSSMPYRYTPTTVVGSQSGYAAYLQPEPYQYAKPPSNISFTHQPQTANSTRQPTEFPVNYTTTRQPLTPSQQALPQTTSLHGSHSRSSSQARIVDVTPDLSKRTSSAPVPRSDRLTVGTASYEMSGGLPPPSPLLEPYKGTYQSISPMTSPMMLSRDDEMDDVPPLTQLSSSTEAIRYDYTKQSQFEKGANNSGKHRKSVSISAPPKHRVEKKRAKVYNAEDDARVINEALLHLRGPDSDPLCDILPHLTHDQILELRSEYKKIAKISGRGINMAKHIKLEIAGNFGKAAYVTALGRWESEGYWANFWYQSHASRRELLIESLMGRTNAEIRNIRASFRDKRYGDDLVKCMEKELKADKFRTAVLGALEARRQEETDVYPADFANKDADILHRCILIREGGESPMLNIILKRSDTHLREVLRAYERQYGKNFAREALQKSNNLVGEVIAHILNGVINKPARDAMLLRHAIKDIKSHNKDELRYDLLISRLVRVHWDRIHLSRVQRDYSIKYEKELEDDIEDATKGDFREFMSELCQQ
ncbi:hypothetical protein AAFC00_004099 [Neodothiora populina]